VLARVRISVPDRPGSLGQVASAIGQAGADIAGLDVLEAQAGRALDDVFVRVRDGDQLQAVQAAVAAIAGVDVVGVQQQVPPVTGHADLELLERVISQPERALQTLLDGAPGALGADWAAIVTFEGENQRAKPVAVSGRGPSLTDLELRAARRLTAVQLDGAPAGQGAVLVPLGATPAALLLVRIEGPEFHQAELWRLGQVGHVVGSVLATD
jgi:ACT domain